MHAAGLCDPGKGAAARARLHGGHGAALASHAALPAEQGARGPREALASVGVPAKFDDGFYDRVQRWIAEAGVAGASGASGTAATRNVMIMVDRLSTDGQDPDAVARENKDTVVRALGGLGATDIVRAESLSFVTATVPLARLAELSEYGSVYRIGDGEELLHKSVGTARSTISAESKARTLSGGKTLTGSGVIVAILDNGIESPALNPRVDKRQHCADLLGCRAQTMLDRVPDKTKTDASHGTKVAGVLAASSGTFGTDTFPAGIATGVTLFDVIVEATSTNNEGAFFTSMANALDWAYTNGAHIANLSYGSPKCNAQGVGALIVDEAVDKGMVVIGAAGNEGKADRNDPSRPDRAYETITGPHCSHNPITVGGVKDRNDKGEALTSLEMYYDSSRGPTKSTITSLNGLLKPDIAAPAPTTPPPAPAPTPPGPARPTATSYGVYVANTDDREVRAYLPDGTYSGAFVTASSGRLDKPWAIDFGPDGNLYVSDFSGGALRRYSGATGAPMGSGADASTNSLWARPSARPYGIAWNGDVLYAATYNGIERFDLAGKALGIFGDASRTATAAGAALVLPHDVEFGGDRMYVADRGNHRIAYYSASTGSYLGAVSSSTASFTTRYPYGVAWDGASLYQSAGDPGRVNKISPSTLALERSLTGAHIDEPLGMDAAPDGRVYVANKDTDQVAVIIAGNTVSTLFASRLDDPRDVAIGLRYAPAAGSGAAGTSGAAGGQGAPNSEPALEVLAGGPPAGPVVDLAAQAGRASVSLRATDAEGDAVSFSMDVLETTMAAGAAAASPPALTDHGNGTATLTVDGSAAGEYLVALSASDAHGEEWGTYLIRVAPAAGSP